LELGTGLGLSAAYQTAALELNGSGSLTTLEGSHAWGAVAEKGLANLGLGKRANVRIGVIEETAPEVAQLVAPIDFAFLDADHSEHATRKDFGFVLPHLSRGAVVVLDDISLSDGMRRAWKAIKRNPSVSWAVGLGRVGLVVVD
jgi:predicted O-methyltransferase YrrM